MINFFQKLAVVWAKNANFLPIFGRGFSERLYQKLLSQPRFILFGGTFVNNKGRNLTKHDFLNFTHICLLTSKNYELFFYKISSAAAQRKFDPWENKRKSKNLNLKEPPRGRFLTFTPRGKLCILEGMLTPLFTPRCEHSVLFRKMAGQTEGLHPQGITSTPSANFKIVLGHGQPFKNDTVSRYADKSNFANRCTVRTATYVGLDIEPTYIHMYVYMYMCTCTYVGGALRCAISR
jgi:hypothetical protein